MWICPICRQDLLPEQGKSLVCRAGHCFDVAREGYVNLLLANRKHSKQPGDSGDMIAARWRVHQAGLYQPLAAAIQQEVSALDSAPGRILDLGCGEGFYSTAMQQALPAAAVLGIDIARPAVKLAAKHCPTGNFAVASVFDVPLQDASLDMVVSVFAPVAQAELSRLLKPGGVYLKVTPGPRHLWELRSLLYDDPRPHQAELPGLDQFESLLETSLDYPLEISAPALRDLVAMTPYAHRGQRENRHKLQELQQFKLQMSFNISLQRYRPGAA